MYPLGLAVLPVVALVAMVWATGAWFVDDAGIVFAYSRSIATGLGPTTSASPAFVEGFSDPAWVAILACLHALGLPIEWCAKALGGAGALMACWTVLTTAREEELPRKDQWALMFTLVMTGPLWLWAVSGLENGLWTWLLIASVCVKHRGWSALAIVLLTWTRPEAPLVIAGVLVSRAWVGHPWRVAALAALASTTALFGVRLSLFEVWWPNTADAKLGRGLVARALSGTRYVLISSIWLGWLPLVLGAYAADRSARHHRLPLYAVGPVATSLLAMLYMGGDWMRYGRFLVGLTPLVALACAPALFAGRRTRWVVVVSWMLGACVWVDAVRRPPLPMTLLSETGQVVQAITHTACPKGVPNLAIPDVGGILWTHPTLTVLDLALLTTLKNEQSWPQRINDAHPHVVITHGPWVQRTGLTPTVMVDLAYTPLCIRPPADGVDEAANPTTLYVSTQCGPLATRDSEVTQQWCERAR